MLFAYSDKLIHICSLRANGRDRSSQRAAEQDGAKKVIAATYDAERHWTELCEELAANSLFWKAEDNWIFGANIPGKKRCLRFYFGGLQKYIQELQKCVRDRYTGFEPFASPSRTGVNGHLRL